MTVRTIEVVEDTEARVEGDTVADAGNKHSIRLGSVAVLDGARAPEGLARYTELA